MRFSPQVSAGKSNLQSVGYMHLRIAMSVVQHICELSALSQRQKVGYTLSLQRQKAGLEDLTETAVLLLPTLPTSLIFTVHAYSHLAS